MDVLTPPLSSKPRRNRRASQALWLRLQRGLRVVRASGLWSFSLMLPLLVACQNHAQHQASFLVFGTVVDVQLRGLSHAQAEARFSALQALFQELHQEWHPWQEGELMRLNQALAQGQSYTPPARLRQLVAYAQEAESASCGLFNAASGELIELWGFHTSNYPILGPPPAPESLQEWLRDAPSMRDIRVQGDQLNSRNPKVRLDLSGLAKGAAVALAVAQLKQHQVPAALVNAGGDLLAYHDTADTTPEWRVAIRDPFDKQRPILAEIQLHGEEAVFTSGNYARYRQDQEQRYAHILDPRNAWPVSHIAAATVVHDEAWRADAAATSLMIAAADEPWEDLAARMGIKMALIVRQDGAIEITPALAARLEEGPWRQRVVRTTRDLSAPRMPSCAPFSMVRRHRAHADEAVQDQATRDQRRSTVAGARG